MLEQKLLFRQVTYRRKVSNFEEDLFGARLMIEKNTYISGMYIRRCINGERSRHRMALY